MAEPKVKTSYSLGLGTTQGQVIYTWFYVHLSLFLSLYFSLAHTHTDNHRNTLHVDINVICHLELREQSLGFELSAEMCLFAYMCASVSYCVWWKEVWVCVCAAIWMDKCVWSTVGCKKRELFMHKFLCACGVVCVCLWLLNSFLCVLNKPMCLWMCVYVGLPVQGLVLMLELVIKNWKGLNDIVEHLAEPGTINRTLVNGHYPYLLGWRALGKVCVCVCKAEEVCTWLNSQETNYSLQCSTLSWGKEAAAWTVCKRKDNKKESKKIGVVSVRLTRQLGALRLRSVWPPVG